MVHSQLPVDEFAVHVLPVVAYAAIASPDELARATCSCTVDPTGAEPVTFSVVAEVRLSVVSVPVSESTCRSRLATVGSS